MTDGASWRDAVLAGDTDPVVPRDSATVVLLRPDPGAGFQVCLLRRASSMRVGAGAYVFPGGTVDARDVEDARASLPWVGPQPPQWAEWLGGPPESAASLVFSAVRETFEESGVLLAGPTGAADPAPLDADPRAWHGQPFTTVLDKLGVTVRADLLRPWSRWVTPCTELRRFDTRFFAAVVPPDQDPWVASPESDLLVWLTPAEAVNRWNAGELPMALPTSETLRELAALLLSARSQRAEALAAQSGAAQTGAAQSGVAQTGAAQSGVAQTGVEQTGAAQSGTAQPGFGVTQVPAQVPAEGSALLEMVLGRTRDMRPVEPAVRRRHGDSVVLLGPDGHEYQPPRIAR